MLESGFLSEAVHLYVSVSLRFLLKSRVYPGNNAESQRHQILTSAKKKSSPPDTTDLSLMSQPWTGCSVCPDERVATQPGLKHLPRWFQVTLVIDITPAPHRSSGELAASYFQTPAAFWWHVLTLRRISAQETAQLEQTFVAFPR